VLLFAGPLAGLFGRKVGFKWPMAIGMALIGVGAGMLAVWHDEPWQIVASQPVFGIGIGFAFAAMATIIAQTVRPSETGVAGGMNTVMRTVGGVIGGQVGAALLTAHTIPGTPIPSVDGFEIAFALGAIAALVGAIVSLFIVTSRQAETRREPALEAA
jgi:MFS family permease